MLPTLSFLTGSEFLTSQILLLGSVRCKNVESFLSLISTFGRSGSKSENTTRQIPPPSTEEYAFSSLTPCESDANSYGCDIFHLCHLLPCQHCTCVHFRRALESQAKRCFHISHNIGLHRLAHCELTFTAKNFPVMANTHSDANRVVPIISQLILTIATSSASPEVRVTFFWVADHVLRVCRPLRIAHRSCSWLSSCSQPSRSRCSRPGSSPRSSWNSKLQTLRGHPRK